MFSRVNACPPVALNPPTHSTISRHANRDERVFLAHFLTERKKILSSPSTFATSPLVGVDGGPRDFATNTTFLRNLYKLVRYKKTAGQRP